MCTRLYPDIIVAAEINNSRRIVQMCTAQSSVSSVHVSIDGCLSRQEDYKQFGICNVFVGYENQEWGEEDYKDFLHMFPEYFQPFEDGYTVDLVALQEGAAEVDLTSQICKKLFTQGTYSIKTLRALGLSAAE